MDAAIPSPIPSAKTAMIQILPAFRSLEGVGAGAGLGSLSFNGGLSGGLLFGDGAAGDDRDVVVLRRLALVLLDLAHEEREILARALVGELLGAEVEAVLAELLVLGVHRLDHAVGVEHEAVALEELDLLLLERLFEERALVD